MIDGLALMPNIIQLKEIAKVYEKNIKKNPNFQEKIYFEINYDVPFKAKPLEKRKTEV